MYCYLTLLQALSRLMIDQCKEMSNFIAYYIRTVTHQYHRQPFAPLLMAYLTYFENKLVDHSHVYIQNICMTHILCSLDIVYLCFQC